MTKPTPTHKEKERKNMMSKEEIPQAEWKGYETRIDQENKHDLEVIKTLEQ